VNVKLVLSDSLLNISLNSSTFTFPIAALKFEV